MSWESHPSVGFSLGGGVKMKNLVYVVFVIGRKPYGL